MAADEPGEFERIRRFFAPLAGAGGLGLRDDAALVYCAAGQSLVVTADAIVAGVHYLPEDPPDTVARKLLRVNLSDLAAMGAQPMHYLLTTALPKELGVEWLARFAQGLGADQKHFGIELVGGDSVSTTGPAVLSLTAVGTVVEGSEVRRSGARPGDLVWVSGTIGDAFLGLRLLRGDFPGLPPGHRDYLVRRFRIPDPRTELGPLLCGIAHAMIDVSDGLVADLGHICENSDVAARIELDLLPLSAAARAIVDIDPVIYPQLATGGDDYELMFAAPAAYASRIAEFSSRLRLPITMIGEIQAGAGVQLINNAGATLPLNTSGYRHF